MAQPLKPAVFPFEIDTNPAWGTIKNQAAWNAFVERHPYSEDRLLEAVECSRRYFSLYNTSGKKTLADYKS